MDNLSWVDNDLAVTKILKYDNSDVENTSGVEIGVEKTDDENNKASKENASNFLKKVLTNAVRDGIMCLWLAVANWQNKRKSIYHMKQSALFF